MRRKRYSLQRNERAEQSSPPPKKSKRAEQEQEVVWTPVRPDAVIAVGQWGPVSGIKVPR